MDTIWVVVLAIVALVVGAGANAVRERWKLRRRIKRGIGKAPRKPEGRFAGSLFWEGWQKTRGTKGTVDDITWNDLDMDAVFARVNTCQSLVGDVWLYKTLHTPDEEPEAGLEKRQRLIEAVQADEGLRLALSYRLAVLGRRFGAGLELPVFYPETLRAPRVWLIRILAAMPLLGLPLLLVDVTLGLVAVAVLLLANFVIYNIRRMKSEDKVALVGYLSGMLGVAGKLAVMLDKIAPEQAEQLRSAAKPFAFLSRNYMIMLADTAITGAGLPDPLAMFQLPYLAYCKIIERLCGMPEEVLALYAAVGEVDIALSVANLRESLPAGCCLPEFAEALEITAQGLYHPLLEEPVTNDCAMFADALFTGSNASGKSTFIKALAIGALMAQTMGTCCAKQFRLGAGFVATSMAVADSIIEGDSYFIAEIKSMKRLVDIANAPRGAYLFIDEILKGTNTIERVAASTALLHHLSGTGQLCFAATHDMELTELLREEYENYHFRETVHKGAVRFDYQLHNGPATSRNAILLLETMGFPSEVTGQARSLAAGFDAAGVWDME